MHDTTITVQGYAGGNVDVRTVGASALATFRLAATPRRYDRKTESWVDAPTQWYTVKAWRTLAHNVAYSVRRGDPIVVHGRLVANTWTTKDGEEVTTMELEATMIGHDLNRGVTQITKPARPSLAPQGEPAGEPAGEPGREPTSEPIGESVREPGDAAGAQGAEAATVDALDGPAPANWSSNVAA